MDDLKLIRFDGNHDERENVLEEIIKSAFISGLTVFLGKLAVGMLKEILSSSEVDSFTKEIIKRDLTVMSRILCIAML